MEPKQCLVQACIFVKWYCNQVLQKNNFKKLKIQKNSNFPTGKDLKFLKFCMDWRWGSTWKPISIAVRNGIRNLFWNKVYLLCLTNVAVIYVIYWENSLNFTIFGLLEIQIWRFKFFTVRLLCMLNTIEHSGQNSHLALVTDFVNDFVNVVCLFVVCFSFLFTSFLIIAS